MTFKCSCKTILLREYHVANDENFLLQVARAERIDFAYLPFFKC